MKKAGDYIDMSKISFRSIFLQYRAIEKWIKAAQIDTIDATVLKCSQEVKLYYTDLEQTTQEIDIDSILSVAEQLKKELE